jgi:hypothetical protein
MEQYTATAKVSDTHNSLFDAVYGVGREAKMIGCGIGNAVADAVYNPYQRLAEFELSFGTGAALGALSRVGAPGRVVAAGIGTAMLLKFSYDELTGQRWSKFGQAFSDAWRTGDNMDKNIAATRDSLGSLLVDSSLGYAGMRAGGIAMSEMAPPSWTAKYAIKQAAVDHGEAMRLLENRWEDPIKSQRATNHQLELVTYSESAVPGEARGDMVRVARTPDGRILLAAMDGYGHGVEAAKLSVQLQVAVDEVLPHTANRGPSEILEMIDQRLKFHDDEGATAAVSIYDPATQKLHTATASDELAYVVHPNGSIERLDADGGTLLGQSLYGMTKSKGDVTSLRPHDVVILASDGTFDRFNWSNTSAFEAFLRDVGAKPAEIKRRILNTPQSNGADDTSFIIFGRGDDFSVAV